MGNKVEDVTRGRCDSEGSEVDSEWVGERKGWAESGNQYRVLCQAKGEASERLRSNIPLSVDEDRKVEGKLDGWRWKKEKAESELNFFIMGAKEVED